ncbi:MAG: alpha-L-rhamnosidase N-terminal domain-containing protein [Kiritimatiellae bacterium]|nr:alpha-L-rhamnosidase N-terminal domain-containing protein [Kiritimatiellia bacterium]
MATDAAFFADGEPPSLYNHIKSSHGGGSQALFRKPFKTSRTVHSARLYISALGYYQASLNGAEIGDHKLDPLWTYPHKRVAPFIAAISFNCYDNIR